MKNAWGKWKVMVEKVGNFQISVVFSLLYFLILTPIGIIANMFSDFLNTKDEPKWHKFEDTTSDLSKLKRQ